MKRRPLLLPICAVTALLFIALIVFLFAPKPEKSSIYESVADPSCFSVTAEALNTTVQETYSLHRGDTIIVSYLRTSGTLALRICKDAQAPIYEGTNPDLSTFHVTIPMDGDYTIAISGKDGQGKIACELQCIQAE